MDEFLALEEVVAIAECGMLVQRVADSEHDVGFDESLPRAGVTAVAEHADGERMVFVDDALAVERGDERYLEAFDKARICGPAPLRIAPNPTSAITFLPSAKASASMLGRGGDVRRIGQNGLHDNARIPVVANLDAAMGEILGHVYVDRAWTALEGQINRLLEHVHRVVDVGQQKALLGGRSEHGL